MKESKLAQARRLLKPGVIVAVPRKTGGFYFLVHLIDNRFGEAFGLIDGHSKDPKINADSRIEPLNRYLYTDNEYVRKGKWQ